MDFNTYTQLKQITHFTSCRYWGNGMYFVIEVPVSLILNKRRWKDGWIHTPKEKEIEIDVVIQNMDNSI